MSWDRVLAHNWIRLRRSDVHPDMIKDGARDTGLYSRSEACTCCADSRITHALTTHLERGHERVLQQLVRRHALEHHLRQHARCSQPDLRCTDMRDAQ